jgi:hypothetical protein
MFGSTIALTNIYQQILESKLNIPSKFDLKLDISDYYKAFLP